MSLPKVGQYYVTTTLLGGEPDRNRRIVRCWRDDDKDNVICTFNYDMQPWPEENDRALNKLVALLNGGERP
jgi:hypothetical protein